jgi:predicted metal-dependent phosphotriesterase family hydrolase
MTLSAGEWTELFAAKLGTAAPSPDEQAWLLELAGTAAHASERTAAPISCWLAARAGVGPDQARLVAQRLADELAAQS